MLLSFVQECYYCVLKGKKKLYNNWQIERPHSAPKKSGTLVQFVRLGLRHKHYRVNEKSSGGRAEHLIFQRDIIFKFKSRSNLARCCVYIATDEAMKHKRSLILAGSTRVRSNRASERWRWRRRMMA